MPKTSTRQRAARTSPDLETDPSQNTNESAGVPALLGGLSSARARVKFGCLKALCAMSRTNPAVVYPHIDLFIKLLDSENNIMRWGAIAILANLASVDAKLRIDAILPRLLRPIRGPVMITAANTIIAAAAIARSKPHLMPTIVNAILGVERAQYQTDECRNIAVGHAIKALDGIFPQIRSKGRVVEFVARQIDNARNATRKKAAAFLARHAVALVMGR